MKMSTSNLPRLCTVWCLKTRTHRTIEHKQTTDRLPLPLVSHQSRQLTLESEQTLFCGTTGILPFQQGSTLKLITGGLPIPLNMQVNAYAKAFITILLTTHQFNATS
jgi:hypothetical protein